MAILVDGYNVLYAVGILGGGVGPGTLERARMALLNFLAASLTPDEAATTTVVFDAADAPGGLPRIYRHRQVTVRFAVGHESADALLEELIRRDSAPRRLTVVSSDHRIQRAARRRRARVADSEAWWEELARRRAKRQPRPENLPAKPVSPLSDNELAYWLEQFGAAADSPPAKRMEQRKLAADQPANRRSTSREIDETDSLANPFPPGYGEDLLCADDGNQLDSKPREEPER
ncbi:MAG: hypothetical protein GXY83_22480 [Rhodopirellula sp.]|nr:hypothetical protein [Rhodopirellula sp.]